jgi:colicin import membrane protein
VSEALAAPQPETGGSSFMFTVGIPLVLALVIHAIAILALVEGWSVTDESRFTPRIAAIDARLIQIEAEAPPAPAQVVERPTPTPAPQPAPAQTRTPEPVREARPAPAERAPEPDPEPAPPPEAAATPQATRQADFEDDALREMLDSALDDAIAAESELIASRRSDAAVASFVGAIVRRIEQNWSRPPSARNGMRAELLIGLVPTGEVVSVEVTSSSGNSAFDRSALRAVRDAAPFEVPPDPVLFEREFRNLRILFRPEDLRN